MRRHLLHYLPTKTMSIGLGIGKHRARHRNQRLLIIPRILSKLIEMRNKPTLLLIYRALNPERQ